MQHQERAQSLNARENEYLAAQRAAVESIMVGRATAETVELQTEQLCRAESIVDETQYKLNKANRTLKGMTWSGWVSNIFTADAKSPQGNGKKVSPKNYEHLPPSCQSAAQSILNYKANLSILHHCETDDQIETCTLICDQMFDAASKEIQKLSDGQEYSAQLKDDLDVLKVQQTSSLSQAKGLLDRVPQIRKLHQADDDADSMKRELFGPRKASKHQVSPASTTPSPSSLQQKQQDEHLAVIAASLGELGSIAGQLNAGFKQQHELIDSLDEKSENVLETSKTVSRRADRLVQKKSWVATKATYHCTSFIRHSDTGRYIAVLGNEMYLVKTFNRETCAFRMYKRQGRILGIQAEGIKKWLGQSWMTGSLMCGSGSFGRREEWEGDEDWSDTRLLCASACWGQGGYLLVNPDNFAIQIGSVQDSRRAAKFSIQELDDINT